MFLACKHFLLADTFMTKASFYCFFLHQTRSKHDGNVHQKAVFIISLVLLGLSTQFRNWCRNMSCLYSPLSKGLLFPDDLTFTHCPVPPSEKLKCPFATFCPGQEVTLPPFIQQVKAICHLFPSFKTLVLFFMTVK